MISRIYVMPARNATHSVAGGPKKESKQVNSYLIDSKLSQKELQTLTEALTNPILENFSINKFPEDGFRGKFNYLIEISFLPGVTDNVAHTVKEIAKDLLKFKKSSDFEVYTSKIFLVSGTIEEVKETAISMHNPLIEKATIVEIKSQKINLPNKVPKVVLEKRKTVINISLNVSDEELIKIGKEGIRDENGKENKRRGPLALDLASMQAIKEHFLKLKRNPTDIELETLAQTWSEHCKHTIFANPIDEIKDGLYKTYIKGATKLIREKKGRKDFCASVFTDNSGGIIFDENYIITDKVETHNTPSALDPFGGAVTGIVGVNRDALGFGLGAKPIINRYGFCFANPDDDSPIYKGKNFTQKMLPPKRIMQGVIAGAHSGGNCSGIPSPQGFVYFDKRYKGKPLVFVGTIGLIPKKIKGKKAYAKKAKPGDYIVMIGGRVGIDGIHGATFSSEALDTGSPATAVQIGDPITQKKFSDAIVKEARDKGPYTSITDNGAGGLSCSVAEMAKESGGCMVDLDTVPLKYSGLEPWQIWISESQERMTLAVPKGKWDAFEKLMNRRGVEATIIGTFTNSKKCIVKYKNITVMNLDIEFLH